MIPRMISISLLVICAFTLIPISTHTQDFPRPKHPFDIGVLYDPIIAIKFPLPPEPPRWGKVIIVLRFPAELGTESQINILQNNDDQFSVQEYYLPPGSRSIWGQLMDLYVLDKLSPNQDPSELAKQFKVESRTVNVPSPILNDLINQLDNLRFPSMEREKIGREFLADLIRYEFWYKTFFLSDMHISFTHVSSHKENAAELADWINRVKHAVDSVK
jgi:hypothetical protein